MSAHTPLPAARQPLDMHQRTELRLGRLDWTPADYRAEGLREFDAQGFKDDGSPWRPSDRKHYADCYVLANCPPAKLRAAREMVS